MDHGTDPPSAGPSWRQVFIHFDNYPAAEETGLAHVGPEMCRAESAGVITSWFFIRKKPCWRLRFLPTPNRIEHDPVAFIRHLLDTWQDAGHIANWVETIYEPETHAFGGTGGMELAHRLFHADSRQILAYLASEHTCTSGKHGDQRRELSILLCSSLMRGAGQDWYEQGDIWARVAEIRSLPPDTPPTRLSNLESGVRRLITADTRPTSPLMQEEGSLAFLCEWADAFHEAGQALGNLAHHGRLSRGVRAVLAHHIIFHWNRLGLPYTIQSLLAHTAKAVVLRPEEGRAK